MKETIEFNEPIKVSVEEQTVTLTSGDKTETKIFRCKDVDFSVDGNSLVLEGHAEKKKTNSIINTVKKHVLNLSFGLETGYEYHMKVIFSHFPMNIQLAGNELIINNFAGGKKPRKAGVVGANTKVEVKGKDIIITGSNKEHVGQTAANFEKATVIKKKDLRVFQDGIYLVTKGVKQGSA